MPNFEPPFGLDPWAIVRDPNRRRNYPALFLRGIYNIMKREEGRMSLAESFLFAHNVIATTLVKKAKRPRFNAKDGFMNYTSAGAEREGEVQGWRKMSKERQRETGYKKDRQEMQKDTQQKLKELDEMLNILMNDSTIPGNSPGQGKTIV